MTRNLGSCGALAVLVSISTGMSGQAPRQPSMANGDWLHYTADLRGTSLIPADQIAQRHQFRHAAWRWRGSFKTDSLTAP